MFVAWIWVLISLFSDLFSDSSVSGWGKAGWTFLLFLVPFLGALVYLIARGGGMHVAPFQTPSSSRPSRSSLLETAPRPHDVREMTSTDQGKETG